MANLDVHRFLACDDDVERGVMQRIANRVQQLNELRDNNLAVRIRNQVMEGLGGKS
jgi:hypothetical protein